MLGQTHLTDQIELHLPPASGVRISLEQERKRGAIALLEITVLQQIPLKYQPIFTKLCKKT